MTDKLRSIDMFAQQQTVEKARRKLELQTAALAATDAEIEFVMNNKPEAKAILHRLQSKRNRQANAVIATQEEIEIFSINTKRR